MVQFLFRPKIMYVGCALAKITNCVCVCGVVQLLNFKKCFKNETKIGWPPNSGKFLVNWIFSGLLFNKLLSLSVGYSLVLCFARVPILACLFMQDEFVSLPRFTLDLRISDKQTSSQDFSTEVEIVSFALKARPHTLEKFKCFESSLSKVFSLYFMRFCRFSAKICVLPSLLKVFSVNLWIC